MSEARKQQFDFDATAVQTTRAEYEDEELDIIHGKNFQAKNVSGERGGADSNDTTKSYTFTGIAPGKVYLHPPARLIKGRVIYPVKFVGQLKVKEPRGNQLLKRTIDMVKIATDVYKTNHPGWDMLEVDLSVSIRSVMCLKRGTKTVIHQHPIHVISYSGDDKRGEKNIFAYIVKPKPPIKDHICYVYECTEGQSVELTSTIGEAFELAYKKFLEAKQAEIELKKLKERYETASSEEKEKIKKQLDAIEEEKEAELERKRRAAENRAKLQATLPPMNVTDIKVKGPPKYYVDEHGYSNIEDPEIAKQLAGVEKEAHVIEVESELKRQKLMKHQTSVATNWENITSALEPFQSDELQVRRFQTKELDDVFANLQAEIAGLEEAFNWVPGKRKFPLDDDLWQEEKEDVDVDKQLADIEGQITSVQLVSDELEIPELPANYVMDEFQKAREKARLPKMGTVKAVADEWYIKHHD